MSLSFCLFVRLPWYFRLILETFSIFEYFQISRLSKTHFEMQYWQLYFCMNTPTKNDTKTKNNLNRPETTWNNLQRPTTTCNEQETTWNYLQRSGTSKRWPGTTYKEQETTWVDPQRVRHNLQWPEYTCNEQRKDAKQPTASRFSGYFTIWGKRFCSLKRFPSNIWLQSFESWWIMVKTEHQASIVMCIFYRI